MQKLDIHGHEQRYKNWKDRVKEDGEEGITKENSNILIKFLSDFEIGQNISNKSKKGARGYMRLNNLRQRLTQIMRMLEKRGVGNITLLTEKKIMDFFNEMRNGTIKTLDGKKYKSVADYVKVFKCFWHWFMKVSKKEGKKKVEDITEDLDSSREEEPKFVYITKEQLEELMPYFDKDEQVCLMFCFDSIIRSPTELLSLKVKDIYEEEHKVWVNLPDGISKTFGRKLSLLYCGEALLEYIKRNGLDSNDYLFKNINYIVLNKKLQQVAKQVFKDRETKGGATFGEITLYDLRHSGAINLRILASKNGKISLEKIRHRGGWKDYRMLNYYTKFIGLDGDIEKEDTLLSEDKTKLEKQIENLKEYVDVQVALSNLNTQELLKYYKVHGVKIDKKNSEEREKLIDQISEMSERLAK